MIVYICKYKLHVYYLANGKMAEPWVRWAIFGVTVLCVLLPSTRSLLVCSTLDFTYFEIF